MRLLLVFVALGLTGVANNARGVASTVGIAHPDDTQPAAHHACDSVGLLDDATDPDSCDGLARQPLPGAKLSAVLRLRLHRGDTPRACLLLAAPKTGPPL
jgi:hypothetical protein